MMMMMIDDDDCIVLMPPLKHLKRPPPFPSPLSPPTYTLYAEIAVLIYQNIHLSV